MFLGRRLEALCSLTVSSPVWPSMIFFVLLFVPPFPFITSFSLAKWMKAKSFWTALKKFTQGICFCLFLKLFGLLQTEFCPEHCSQVTVHSEFLLLWHHLHKSSATSVFILGFQSCPLKIWTHRELLWSQKIISIQGPCCFFFIRIVCNFMDKMYTQGSYQLTWDI